MDIPMSLILKLYHITFVRYQNTTARKINKLYISRQILYRPSISWLSISRLAQNRCAGRRGSDEVVHSYRAVVQTLLNCK